MKKLYLISVMLLTSTMATAQMQSLSKNQSLNSQTFNTPAPQTVQPQQPAPQVKTPQPASQPTITTPAKKYNSDVQVNKDGSMTKVGSYQTCLNQAKEMSDQMHIMPVVIKQEQQLKTFQWNQGTQTMTLECDGNNNKMNMIVKR